MRLPYFIKAKELELKISLVCNYVIKPAAIKHIVYGGVRIDVFIGPDHVSTIIGTKPYECLVERYRRPIAILGFEPIDVLRAVLSLVNQLVVGEYRVDNVY